MSSLKRPEIPRDAIPDSGSNMSNSDMESSHSTTPQTHPPLSTPHVSSSPALLTPDSTSPKLPGLHPHHHHRKRRHIRTSRLDYECNESSINKSEFRGFLNLFNLSVGMFLISDPVLRYFETGRFLDPSLAEAMFEDIFLLLFNWLQCFLWSFTAFFAYHAFVAGYIPRFAVRVIQHSTQSAMIAYSVAVCLYQDWPILPCGFTLIVAIISFMKMHSFTESLLDMHDIRKRLKETCVPIPAASPSIPSSSSTTTSLTKINTTPFQSAMDRQIFELRRRHSTTIEEKRAKGSFEVPNEPPKSDNQVLSEILDEDLSTTPTLSFFVYYLFCPVLVYESQYPKGQSFRHLYFVNKLIALMAAMVALYLISTRYLVPTIYSTTSHSFLFTLIKLLWPMLFCYLLVFFILFECICNLLAELTSFGDREFYHDWWNSTTLDEFSRKWNRPVHEFLLRHVYYKSLYRFKLSKFQATVATFFFSALMHELIMAVCFKVVRFWMFTLMMLQVPLIAIGQHYKGTDLGNLIFWAGMAVGIPLLSIAYGREYAIKRLAEMSNA